MTSLSRGYYYLAPLWLTLEFTVLPNIRSGIISGGESSITVAFYFVEALIGAAFWFKHPMAGYAALTENILYVLLAARFIIIAPLDIALAIDGDPEVVEKMATLYKQSVPGIIVSVAYLSLVMKDRLLALVKKLNKDGGPAS